MTRVAVVGGGFAGLSAAVTLMDAGASVALFESSRHLGGRARSFVDTTTGDTVDNGQHLLMRCYDATLAFLHRIGASDRVTFQQRLHIPFLGPDGARAALAVPSLFPGALATAVGLYRLPGVTRSDLAGLRRLAKDLDRSPSPTVSVKDWLNAYDQSPGIRLHFWDPLCLAALNLSPEDAPSHHLAAVLRIAFQQGPSASALGTPSVGLSSLFADGSERVLQDGGAEVRLGAQVSEASGGVVRLRSGEEEGFDACLLAVPPPGLNRIAGEHLPDDIARALSAAVPSAILSVNLWFEHDLPFLEGRPFAGLLGTDTHWVFNKPLLYGGRDKASPGHVTLVTSAANHLVASSDQDLVHAALRDLVRASGADLPALRHSLVVREHRATYAFSTVEPPPPGLVSASLALAGDWTNTGLPCTIESAVLSGRLAAESIVSGLR